MATISASQVSFEDFKKIVYQPPSFDYEIILTEKGLEAIALNKNPTDERILQRKAAWKVFVRIVEENLSLERLDFIKQRYLLTSEWQEWQEKSVPLASQIVEKIGVGAANIYTADLKEILREETKRDKVKLSLCTEADLKRLYDKADPFKFIQNVPNKLDITGGPQKPGSYVTHDFFEDDRVRLILSQDFENLKQRVEEAAKKNPCLGNQVPHFFHVFCQRLAMAIVTCETEEKKKGKKIRKAIIPAPRLDGQTGLDFYKVYDIIIGRGLYAVPLKPVLFTSPLPPIVTFRPTVPAMKHINGPDTLIEDLNPEIGCLGYEAAKKELSELMEDPKFFGLSKGIVTLAYSLGGAYDGYFLENHWRKVSTALFFNTVSNASKNPLDYTRAVLRLFLKDSSIDWLLKNKIDKKPIESKDAFHVIEELAKQINQLNPEEHGPSFYINRCITHSDGTKGDVVHFNGEKHPGCGITHPNTFVQVQNILVDLKTPEDYFDPQLIKVHAFRFLEPEALESYVKGVYTYRHPKLLETHLDNKKRRPEYEELRRTAAEILFPILNYGFLILSFLSRFFNVPLFRVHHDVSQNNRNQTDV